MQRCNKTMRCGSAMTALGLVLGLSLAACAPEYLDRRETISLNGGDAIATNRVTQMVDPWSRASADKNIAFNGEKMQSAVERYRKNKVTAPRGIGTSGTYAPQAADPAAAAPPVGQGVAPAAAPVK